MTNIKRRYPIADIYVFPSAVQGESAPKELLKAFQKSQEYDLDTLIIGRGGGASEDLSAFNDETLVRSIANSKMPVIAAVGHEIDVTLVDYVADKRASTPTGAAELATVDMREIIQNFQDSIDTMNRALREQVEDMKEDVASLCEELKEAMEEKLEYLAREIKSRKDQLEALNPKQVLKRGYSISMNEKGQVVSSVKDVKPGEKIKTSLKDGSVLSTVDSVED